MLRATARLPRRGPAKTTAGRALMCAPRQPTSAMLASDQNETCGQRPTCLWHAEHLHAWQTTVLARRSAEVFPRLESDNGKDVLLQAFRLHEADLRRFLRARGASGPDCDDLTQEIFLRVARQENLQARLSGTPASIKAYLIVIASNLIYDRHRRSVSRQSRCHEDIEKVTVVDRRPTPEQDTVIQQTLSAVHAVLADLDPKCSQAFRMSRFDDMSYQEIALKLDVSVSMIEKYVAKALLAVRAHIEFEAQP